MSGVTTKPIPHGNPLGGLIVEENNETEQQLCNMVETMILTSTSAHQKSTSNVDSSLAFGRAALYFKANGIRIASGRASDDTSSKTSSADSGSGLQAQLESCCDLLRKVDSERRQMRNQCIYLQKEHALRRAELQALHRYSTESHQRSLALERQALEERQRCKRLQDEVDNQTQEVMRLRRFLRALPHNFLVPQSSQQPTDGALVEALQTLVPDRRFEEAFRDKMNSIAYKRRYRQTKAMHQAASEQLEVLMMEQQDLFQVAVPWHFASEDMLAKNVLPNEPVVKRERRGSSSDTFHQSEFPLYGVDESRLDKSMNVGAASTLASRASLQSAQGFLFQLPFTPAHPNDAYIKFLVHHSAYAEPLTQLRDLVLRLSSRLKVAQDTGLGELYTTFTQVLSCFTPPHAQAKWRSLYERQMEKMQRAHRDLLYAVVEQVNTAATQIPELERRGAGGADLAQIKLDNGAPKRRDIGCTAQESTTMEKYRSSQLKEQLVQLKLHSLEAATAAQQEKEEMVKQLSTARLGALQALQSLRALAKSVVCAVHKKDSANDTVYDPFAQLPDPLPEEELDDPRLTTKTAEATDFVISYVDMLARSDGGASRGSGAQQCRVGWGGAPLSSSRTSGGDGARDAALEDIIDIPRAALGSTAPSITSRKESSRRESPSSDVKPLNRGPRKSNVGRLDRRLSAPQLPPMTNSSEFKGKQKTSGKRRNSCAAAPPQHRSLRGEDLFSTATLAEPALGDTMKSQKVRVSGRGYKPQEVIAVVELGFCDNNIKL
ncbi:hypothetical protein JKF63_02882 [Porcisia hertigi]|uniref:Uncharacterized protein n=1 Tax=Porcisia hertigi TaxID=2761500 RepID=A0A836IIS4_9TRYP|nr:hypothetical protein JKF63_02882 [Porcisia hertigi]